MASKTQLNKIETVTPEGLEGEAIESRYIELSSLRAWDRNPKKHKLRQLIEIFIKHGFWDPVKWDSKLNKGKGGIKAGNGRYAALSYMKENSFQPPRGILVRKVDGEWMIPVIFGVDAHSLIEAEAAGFDHNIATLAGSDLTDEQQLSIYDLTQLRPMLQDIEEATQLPLFLQSLEEKKLEKLLGKGELELEGAEGVADAPEVKQPKNAPNHVRTVQIFLDNKETFPRFQRAVARLKAYYEKQEGAEERSLVYTDVVYMSVLYAAETLAPLTEEEKAAELEAAQRTLEAAETEQAEPAEVQENVPEDMPKPIARPGDFVIVVPKDSELCESCRAAEGEVVLQPNTGRRNVELRKACKCANGYRASFSVVMEDVAEEDDGVENEGSKTVEGAPF